MHDLLPQPLSLSLSVLLIKIPTGTYEFVLGLLFSISGMHDLLPQPLSLSLPVLLIKISTYEFVLGLFFSLPGMHDLLPQPQPQPACFTYKDIYL